MFVSCFVQLLLGFDFMFLPILLDSTSVSSNSTRFYSVLVHRLLEVAAGLREICGRINQGGGEGAPRCSVLSPWEASYGPHPLQRDRDPYTPVISTCSILLQSTAIYL